MTKIGTKNAALAMYASLEGKSGGELETALGNCLEFLVGRGLLPRSGEILDELQKIFDKKENVLRARVRSKSEPEKNLVNEIKNFLEKRYGRNRVVIEWKEDKALLGGVRIEAEHEIIDLSLENRINQLQNYLLDEHARI